MGKKVEFEQFDPHISIFEGYIGWRLLLQQPLGTNRVNEWYELLGKKSCNKLNITIIIIIIVMVVPVGKA